MNSMERVIVVERVGQESLELQQEVTDHPDNVRSERERERESYKNINFKGLDANISSSSVF